MPSVLSKERAYCHAELAVSTPEVAVTVAGRPTDFINPCTPGWPGWAGPGANAGAQLEPANCYTSQSSPGSTYKVTLNWSRPPTGWSGDVTFGISEPVPMTSSPRRRSAHIDRTAVGDVGGGGGGWAKQRPLHVRLLAFRHSVHLHPTLLLGFQLPGDRLQWRI